MIYLLEILAIQMAVRSGIYEVGYIYATSNLHTEVITNNQMEKTLVEVIGKDRLDASIIVNGSAGFDLSSTQMNYGTGVIQLVVDYKVTLPIPDFTNLGLKYREKVLFKR